MSSARALEISEKQATEIEHADTDFKSAHVIRNWTSTDDGINDDT